MPTGRVNRVDSPSQSQDLSQMRISRTLATATACIFASCGALAQVNKCTVNGRVVYQQESCPSGAGAAELRVETPPTAPRAAGPGGANPTQLGHADPHLEELRQNMLRARKEEDEAIGRHCTGKAIAAPIIGMSEADLMCIPKFRSPAKVNVTTTAGGNSKQYIYKVRDRTSYIYFVNGRLTATQGELGLL